MAQKNGEQVALDLTCGDCTKRNTLTALCEKFHVWVSRSDKPAARIPATISWLPIVSTKSCIEIKEVHE